MKKVISSIFNPIAMKICDLHQDIAYSAQKMNVVTGDGQSSVAMLSKFDSAIIISAIFPFFTSMRRGIGGSLEKEPKFEHVNIPDWNVLNDQLLFYSELERSGYTTIVRRKSDLDGNGVKLLLGMEGTDTLRDPEDVFFLYRMGLRSLGLAWNLDSKFAASYLSEKDYGLTGSGRRLVSYCNELGIALDLSHSSRNTILDIMEVNHGPIFISHGNSDSVYHHPRNYTDDILDMVTSKGGIIGITGIRSTLGYGQDMYAMIKHIDYVGDTFGWDHVAVGSDFLGVDTTVSGFESVLKFQDLAKNLGNKSEKVIWKNGHDFLLGIFP